MAQLAAHYPSSAELAAFRWRIALTHADGRHGPLAGYPIPGPFAEPRRSGAWPKERQHGIGYRGVTASGYRASGANDYAETRRGAAAMRSRAFAWTPSDGTCPSLEPFYGCPAAWGMTTD